MIQVLSKDTIDKIAAGEVIERPMSVVKELVENAIDAKSSSITVEIKDGGVSLIRVTDNGCGIDAKEVKTAFDRHATSKITDAEDLNSVMTLGFRGEALSSIAAVSRTEIITRTKDSVTAVRYTINGGIGESLEEVGAPEGTTIIVRDLFYNVPARRKFLKSPATEASHISELMEIMALSHGDISFTFINNGQTRLKTSGNGKLIDIIYQIYGRDITKSIIPIEYHGGIANIYGIIGKPDVTRSNRNFETYFVNGRYIKSSVIWKAIEDAYGNRLMQHQFPFAVLLIETDPSRMDVNVHPTKMDVRFSDASEIYDNVLSAVRDALDETVLIPKANEVDKKVFIDIEQDSASKLPFDNKHIEPFENHRPVTFVQAKFEDIDTEVPKVEQLKADFVTRKTLRIIGQVFDTYWIVESNEKMYIIDQHAAHEKVLFERLLKSHKSDAITSQQLNPPGIISLSDSEADILLNNPEVFRKAGYEIESFGGKEYAVYAVPADLPSVPKADVLKEMLNELATEGVKKDVELILAKTASMACKAAIKGGQKISYQEAEILFRELMECDQPFNCPHGRPTMVEYSKTDIEKLFKRIV